MSLYRVMWILFSLVVIFMVIFTIFSFVSSIGGPWYGGILGWSIALTTVSPYLYISIFIISTIQVFWIRGINQGDSNVSQPASKHTRYRIKIPLIIGANILGSSMAGWLFFIIDPSDQGHYLFFIFFPIIFMLLFACIYIHKRSFISTFNFLKKNDIKVGKKLEWVISFPFRFLIISFVPTLFILPFVDRSLFVVVICLYDIALLMVLLVTTLSAIYKVRKMLRHIPLYESQHNWISSSDIIDNRAKINHISKGNSNNIPTDIIVMSIRFYTYVTIFYAVGTFFSIYYYICIVVFLFQLIILNRINYADFLLPIAFIVFFISFLLNILLSFIIRGNLRDSGRYVVNKDQRRYVYTFIIFLISIFLYGPIRQSGAPSSVEWIAHSVGLILGTTFLFGFFYIHKRIFSDTCKVLSSYGMKKASTIDRISSIPLWTFTLSWIPMSTCFFIENGPINGILSIYIGVLFIMMLVTTFVCCGLIISVLEKADYPQASA